MKLTGWSFTLEDSWGRGVEIKGQPCQDSYEQWGASNVELGYTVSLCEQIIQQAEADGLIKKEQAY